MENLKVLYLKGNGIIKGIKHYRKTLINQLKNLTYLDDRPVDEGDRLGSEAFFRGGLEEERKVREECRRMKDTGYKIRKMEEDKEKVSFEERKEKAKKALRHEFLTKKEFLESKKRKLIQEYQEIPKEDLTAKREKTREIMAVDFQMKENEKLKVEEEQEIIFSMALRERHNTYSLFEYEDWMDPILINNVVENVFDFATALKLIKVELKNRNVPNFDLFSVFELRSRWTDIELKHFRKAKEASNQEGKENVNANNEDWQRKESERMLKAEKDKRVILSTLQEAKIDESVFIHSTEKPSSYVDRIKEEQEKVLGKEENDIKGDGNQIAKGDEGENKSEIKDASSAEDKGFKLQIKEEEINFSELD